MKFTNFDNNSNVGYFNLVQNDYLEDPTKSNIFDHNEQNYAVYISAQKDFSKQWSVKAALRYEYSVVDGHTPDNTDGSHFRYGKQFPSFYHRRYAFVHLLFAAFFVFISFTHFSFCCIAS